jgi:hypothetical protein
LIAYVTGILGAGKSYYGARKIADALLRGKVVATNMKLVPGWEKIVLSHSPYYRSSKKKESFEREIRTRYAWIPDIEYLVSASIRGKGESRGVRLIDEAHNEINNRTWLAENQKLVLRRMALARKRGWDDYILAQHRDNTDAALRRISGVEIKLINWRNLLILPFFQTKILPFHLFLAMAFPLSGQRHARKTKVLWREVYGLGWQKNIYDTFEDFDLRTIEDEDPREKYPRLPIFADGGFDPHEFAAVEGVAALLKYLQSPTDSPMISGTESFDQGGLQVPFKKSTPTVTAKGIERADVLDLLAVLPTLSDGEFASDETKYESRASANAQAAKFIRVAESMEDVSLRSRTWESPDGDGWLFGIRAKDGEPVTVAISGNGQEPEPEKGAVPKRPARSRSTSE